MSGSDSGAPSADTNCRLKTACPLSVRVVFTATTAACATSLRLMSACASACVIMTAPALRAPVSLTVSVSVDSGVVSSRIGMEIAPLAEFTAMVTLPVSAPVMSSASTPPPGTTR